MTYSPEGTFNTARWLARCPASQRVPQALKLQIQLARKVIQTPRQGQIQWIAGADVAFSPDGDRCLAVVVLLNYWTLEMVESVWAESPVWLPYIPGLLSFREAPAIVAAARKLHQKPDILLLDGQGLAHPRRFGLACHVGVELDWPTIGCAKSRLIGRHRSPAPAKGSCTRLRDDDQVIGAVLRSRSQVKCLYISVGHKISLDAAVKIVLHCCRQYRLPQPTRLAHQLVTRLRTDPEIILPGHS